MNYVELIITVIAGVALAFLINKYTQLMGFHLTAGAFGAVLTGFVVQAARNEPLLELLGAYAMKNTSWFLVACGAVGLVVFVLGGVMFLRNYEKLERRMAARPPTTAESVPASDREAKARELEKLTQGLYKRVNEWWTFCEQPQAAAQYREQAEDIRDKIINQLKSWGLETEAGYFNRPKPVEPHRRNLERCPEGVLINEMWYRVTRAEEIIEKIKSGKISVGKRNDVTRLTKLRDEGVTLRNRRVASDPQWVVFHRDFQGWDKSVGKAMHDVGVRPSDINWFETLDLVPPLQFSHAHNDLHAKDLRELSEKLRRLLEIIQRHDH